jgi:hypothetical protein
MKGSVADRPAVLPSNGKEDSEFRDHERQGSVAEDSAYISSQWHSTAGLQGAFGNRAAQKVLTSRVCAKTETETVENTSTEEAGREESGSEPDRQFAVAPGSDDGSHRNGSHPTASPTSAQKQLLRRASIRILQQSLGNKAVARLIQEPPLAPSLSSPSSSATPSVPSASAPPSASASTQASVSAVGGSPSAPAAPATAPPQSSAQTTPAPASASTLPAGGSASAASATAPSNGTAQKASSSAEAGPVTSTKADAAAPVVPAAQVDTSSSEAALQSLASSPASSFAESLRLAKSSATAIQTREHADLQKTYPEIERPTGMAPGPTPPKRALTTAAPKTAQVKSPSGGGGGGPVLASKTEVAAGPLPGAGISANATEPPAGDNDTGSWWNWLTNRLRSFFGSLPTTDPGLSTSAGARPKTDLSGDADPAQNEQAAAAGRHQVEGERNQADAAVSQRFGEDDIAPAVRSGKLRPRSAKSGGPSAHPGGKSSPALPDDMRAQLDAARGPALKAEVDPQLARHREQKAQFDATSRQVRDDGQRRIAAENERTRGQQVGLKQQARTDVEHQREQWRAENRKVVDNYSDGTQAKRQETEKQIDDKAKSTDAAVEDKLSQAESKAEQERTKAEQRAAQKKAEEENKPRSFWDKVKGAVSSVFDALKSAITGIFEELRRVVKKVIDEAKALVHDLIQAARQVIIGLIKVFAEVVKAAISVALAAFPSVAQKARDWIDHRVDDAVSAVNRAADALEKAVDSILDAIGAALDAALRVLEAAFLAILDTLETIANVLILIMEELAKLVKLIARFRPIVERIWRLVQDPTPALEAIKNYVAPFIEQVPEKARTLALKAITFSDPPKCHWAGIWHYLKANLENLKENWWDILKTTAWHLIWPFAKDSPLWTDVPDFFKTIGQAFTNLWHGNFSKAVDDGLRIWQLANNILGLFYGWAFIGIVGGFAIAGGIAGAEVGVLPGVAAGAAAGFQIAEGIGLGLTGSLVQNEMLIIAKSGFDLVRGKNTPEEDDPDYRKIANSALTLGITGALFAIGWIASKIAGAIINRVAKGVWRRPALRGRGVEARGDVIEFRVALSEKVMALVRGRTVTWLEAIRRNFDVIDLAEDAQITVTPRPGRAPLYQVTGGRVISVKSTIRVGADAVTDITKWMDALRRGPAAGRNVSVVNPTGRTLIVATQHALDDATVATLRANAAARGIDLQLVSDLPPNHPAVIFADDLPAILAAAGITAAHDACGESEPAEAGAQ